MGSAPWRFTSAQAAGEPRPDTVQEGTSPKPSGQSFGSYLTSKARKRSWAPALRYNT